LKPSEDIFEKKKNEETEHANFMQFSDVDGISG
jgi:hypothetical protein